jgi:hypothetical protein
VCFELCSNGEGRVDHKSVLKVARAARRLIQDHPLASCSGTTCNTDQSASFGEHYLVNLQPNQQNTPSTAPQPDTQHEGVAPSWISEDSYIKSNKTDPALQPSQGYPAGGPPPMDSSGGLPPNASLSTSAGVSEGTSTQDISVQNGNINPVAAGPASDARSDMGEHGEDEYASIPGIATRNGGFEALAFPDGIFMMHSSVTFLRF